MTQTLSPALLLDVTLYYLISYKSSSLRILEVRKGMPLSKSIEEPKGRLSHKKKTTSISRNKGKRSKYTLSRTVTTLGEVQSINRRFVPLLLLFWLSLEMIFFKR